MTDPKGSCCNDAGVCVDVKETVVEAVVPTTDCKDPTDCCGTPEACTKEEKAVA